MSATPWTGLFKIDNVELRHYSLSHDASKKPAILILFGLINYPTILDLHPDRSIIRRLLENGADVYLINWGDPPSIIEKQIIFEDYVFYLSEIIHYLNIPDIHLMGVCQGGIISLLFSALFPERYKKLILFLSPVDFSYQNAFIQSFSCIHTQKMVNNFGNIPGRLMAKFLALFSPYSTEFISKKQNNDMSSAVKKSSSFYQDLADWAYCSPAQAGFAFQEFVQEYIHQNKLIKSELTVLGRRVYLKNIQKPILNIFASEDHLWSPESSKALKKYLCPNTDYSEMVFKGGHLAAVISKQAQVLIPQKIMDFIQDK